MWSVCEELAVPSWQGRRDKDKAPTRRMRNVPPSHQQYVLPYCSSCLWYIWNSNHILEAHACFLVSLCLLFASVGQASARPIASLPWTLFTSLLTHRLVLLCIDAHCFIFWALPGHVLAAPESALGLERCNTSLSLSLSQPGWLECHVIYLSIYLSPIPRMHQPCVAGKV